MTKKICKRAERASHSRRSGDPKACIRQQLFRTGRCKDGSGSFAQQHERSVLRRCEWW
jgi:hypothetical protein